MATVKQTSNLEWWQTSIIYQIYPRSFQDSNGDGVGDIKGITSRLEYFTYLGIEALWLSPVYKSPMVDFGYDISDFTDIDPVFGSLTDIDDLIKQMHKKGMKLIMDFIPNHTSDQHRWFQESRKGGKSNPYLDYYIWRDGRKNGDGTISKPNNWTSVFGGSAWTWDEVRGQYYLHQFAPEQPDLNWRNPDVVEEMDNVICFWLNRGVDGFRVDAIDTLFERNYDQDEPIDQECENLPEIDDRRLKHIYTRHQPEIHEVTRRWRRIFDEHKKNTGKEIYMVTEVYDLELIHCMKYYESGSSQPFNFNLVELIQKDSGGTDIHRIIEAFLSKMPKDKWPSWVLGNHDRKRITTRKGPEYADVMNLLLLTLPGTPTTYQGEELGQLDVHVTFEDTVDPWGLNYGPELYLDYSRDCCRAPIQWSSSKNAGFSTSSKTWLPVHEDYVTRNVDAQRKDPSGKSTLQIYKKAAELRKLPEFQTNTVTFALVTADILSYMRFTKDSDVYLVILNVGLKTSSEKFGNHLQKHVMKQDAEIVLGVGKNFNIGDKINLDEELTLLPASGVILKLRVVA